MKKQFTLIDTPGHIDFSALASDEYDTLKEVVWKKSD